MKKTSICRIALPSFISLFDAITMFLLVLKFGTDSSTAQKAFHNFSLSTGSFDLLILSWTRILVVLICSIALLVDKSAVSQKKLKKIETALKLLFSVFGQYSFLKLLFYDEGAINLNNIWLWLKLSCNFIFSIVELILLGFLFDFERLQVSNSSLVVNAESDESTPLLNPVSSSSNTENGGVQNRDSNEKESSQTEDDDEKKKDEEPVPSGTIKRLLRFASPDIHLICLAAVCLVLSSSADIFLPFYTGEVIAGITIDKSTSAFSRAILFMALLSIGSAIFAGFRGGIFNIVSARFNIRVRSRLFSSILDQEVGFFDETQTGDITSRLTTDVTTMGDTLTLNINVFMRNLITCIGTCVFMLKLSWQLSMVTIISLPLVVIISAWYGEFFEKIYKALQDAFAAANNVAEEVFSSIRTVRSFANENGEVECYKAKLDDAYKIWKKMAVAYGGYIWCTELFALMLIVATLYYGGHLVVTGRMDPANLVSFILYQFQLGSSIENMGSVYTGLMQAAGASHKVFQLIDRESKIKPEDEGDKLTPDTLNGHIQFDMVNFNYPSRPDHQVLKKMSFEVKPGEIVALVGPSGGGKSSCINLLQHFYEPTEGRVLIDSIPIQDYSHKYLHQKVALVGQEPVLFAKSVKENIRYGLTSECSDEIIEKAAKLANAHSFITDMKKGYNSKTGEKGVQLSGGQKQRVAIARALIRDPVILLLDEATSALDAESEHIVQEAIYSNLKGRTVMIVAHRLSTVEKANRIIVIDKGEVVEQGTHRQLLQQSGMYAKLVSRQIYAFDEPLALPTAGTTIDDSETIPAAPGTGVGKKPIRTNATESSTVCRHCRHRNKMTPQVSRTDRPIDRPTERSMSLTASILTGGGRPIPFTSSSRTRARTHSHGPRSLDDGAAAPLLPLTIGSCH